MNWIVFAFLAALATVSQLAVVPLFAIGHAVPDVGIIVLAAIALRTGRNTACIAGWTLGLMRDLTGGSGPGPFALTFLLAALLTNLLRGGLFPSRPVGMGIACFIAACSAHAPYGVVLAIRYGMGFWGAVGHTLAVALFTAIVGALAAKPFAKIRGVAGWAPEREMLA
ncbi:MAG: rod shape-determining protein MreD [Planctomycetes bacterium]|nr:rod shape-determining protein MreD [Planctomycetota bacterium]